MTALWLIDFIGYQPTFRFRLTDLLLATAAVALTATVGQSAILSNVGRLAVEVGGDCQRSRELERRIDCRKFAQPDTAT